MAAKDVRNLILTLVILALGIKAIAFVSQTYTATAASAAAASGLDVTSLVSAVSSLSNLIIIGLAVLVIILIPVWLSKRSGEKKLAPVKGV
jgi:hypothetical protein